MSGSTVFRGSQSLHYSIVKNAFIFWVVAGLFHMLSLSISSVQLT